MPLASESPALAKNRRDFWRDNAGNPITCQEKIRLLDESVQEMQQVCQEALDDALLLGCSEAQFRSVVRDILANLQATVRERSSS